MKEQEIRERVGVFLRTVVVPASVGLALTGCGGSNDTPSDGGKGTATATASDTSIRTLYMAPMLDAGPSFQTEVQTQTRTMVTLYFAPMPEPPVAK